MHNFRQFLLGIFILTTSHSTCGQNVTTTDEQSSVKSMIPAEMKITSWNDMPFSGLVQENGTWVGKGYAFYLLELLSSKLNFTYTIIPPKQHILGNDRSGILSLLYERKVDMAVAFLPVLPEMRRYCTFSIVLDQSELTVLMKRPQESATGSGLLTPFNQTVWLLVLTAVLVVGPIIYIFATFREKLWKKPDFENYSLFSCVWFVYSSLLKQGTNIIATTDSTRILFATWWIFILILTSFYTANLTAFLTKPQFTLPINNLQDIVRKGYQWVTYKGRIIDFVLSHHITDELSLLNTVKYQYITSYEYPVKSIFNAVEKNKLFLGDTHYLQSLIFADYINKTREGVLHQKRCTYVIMPGTIFVTSRAFAFPVNSTLEKPFNKELRALVESGIIIREKLKNLPLAQTCPLDLRSTERQLSFSDLSLTFKVMGAGYLIATVIFILEWMIKWTMNSYKRRKKTGRCTLCCKWKRRSNESVTPQLVYTKKNHLFNKRVNLQNISPLYRNTPPDSTPGKKHNINGRDYYIVIDRYGDQRLIPIRTPSAFLFQYTV
ncbi:Glutamate receptor delta-2 subunit [Camponotus floridanus]|uniref:Glutamate receptor delta-2 subunit n=1 Tax=Camponotus floridanus TaxID=104421 RepID=E2AXX0_CAMFO|nr:glutamate receptor ionotropic, delta-2 [Camponotus floridanus]EFN61734.1 Glutamate receptor delta-2 subunit [Camponotus floridanus]